MTRDKAIRKTHPTVAVINAETQAWDSEGNEVTLNEELIATEMEKLQLGYDFLKSIKVDKSEMSVMFRMPSESHKKFNDFIKENKLNSPISEKTKVVFISSKLPKPLIKSKIKFNSLINLGFGGVHYSIKNFVENQENCISYTEKILQKEFEFVLV
jgi:preprotein translocase subunit SecD